jgi:hypothetical protein
VQEGEIVYRHIALLIAVFFSFSFSLMLGKKGSVTQKKEAGSSCETSVNASVPSYHDRFVSVTNEH